MDSQGMHKESKHFYKFIIYITGSRFGTDVTRLRTLLHYHLSVNIEILIADFRFLGYIGRSIVYAILKPVFNCIYIAKLRSTIRELL